MSVPVPPSDAIAVEILGDTGFDWLELASGLGPVLIAAFALYLGYRQFRAGVKRENERWEAQVAQERVRWQQQVDFELARWHEQVRFERDRWLTDERREFYARYMRLLDAAVRQVHLALVARAEERPADRELLQEAIHDHGHVFDEARILGSDEFCLLADEAREALLNLCTLATRGTPEECRAAHDDSTLWRNYWQTVDQAREEVSGGEMRDRPPSAESSGREED